MTRDLGLAWRALRRSPTYTLAASAVLAVGIALPAATFAVVDGVLFEPLPYDDAHELYVVRTHVATDPSDGAAVTAAQVAAWRQAAPELEIGTASARATREEQVGRPDSFSAGIDEHFLAVFRVRPLVGGFRPEDHRIARQPGGFETPELITYRRWQAVYAADPTVVGREVVISDRDGARYTARIAGVLHRSFVFPALGSQETPNVLTPLEVAPRRTDADRYAFVRVPNRRDVPAVQARLERSMAQSVDPAQSTDQGHRQSPVSPGIHRVVLVPLAAELGREERPIFAVAMAAALLLLLLACLNVAGLAAARVRERDRGRAIRRVLGARRSDELRAHLAEALVLVVPVGAAAVLLAQALLDVVVPLLPESLTLVSPPAIDGRVLAASALLSAASLVAITVGLGFVDAHRPLATVLSRSALTVTRSGRADRWFAAGQTAIGVVLTMAAGLTIASVVAVRGEETGYRRERVAIIEAYAAFYDSTRPASGQLVDAWRSLARVGGVTDVAVSSVQPLFRSAATAPWSTWQPAVGGDMANVSSRQVSFNYFSVLNLEMVEGSAPERAVWEADGPVAIVSESAARAWWPDRSPLGQLLVPVAERRRATTAPKVVVGVVRDARYVALDRGPMRDIYVPGPITSATNGAIFLVSTAAPTDVVMPSLLHAIAPQRLRVAQAVAFDDALAQSVRHRALPAWLYGLMGGAALLMLAVGILGMLAMTVGRRVREMGIRLALGSTRAGIVWLVVGEQLRAVVAGLGVGTVVAGWGGSLLESQLYRVSSYDVWVWIAVPAVVLGAVCLGALIPALRSARTNPVEALRAD